jgi:hypothetical protein
MRRTVFPKEGASFGYWSSSRGSLGMQRGCAMATKRCGICGLLVAGGVGRNEERRATY